MNTIQFRFTGKPSIVTIDKPETLAVDEILVRVKYSALDTSFQACLDKQLMGYFIHALKEPLYLGYHYSGTVEAVGSSVTGISEGTDVFGHLQFEPSQSQGALSEYIVVKRKDCAIKPPGVSHEIAAASTTESITALQAMRDLGDLQKGASILVIGAGGGVGNVAVQIAKSLGARVTAVCSRSDMMQVKALGADFVLDKTSHPDYLDKLIQRREKFDVILDTPNMLPAKATKLLARKGTIVNTFPTISFLWNKVKTSFRSKKTFFVECDSNEADLNLIGKWLEEGTLKIPIDSTYKVKDIVAALAKQNNQKKGRVLIQVENGWQ